MKLLLDEHLSPWLVQGCAEKGIFAVAVAHVGLAGQSDPTLWRYAFDNNFVIVTANTRDFIPLLDREICPGLIVLRKGSLSRAEQWKWLENALDRILENPDPAKYMVNRVVEILSADRILVRQVPLGRL